IQERALEKAAQQSPEKITQAVAGLPDAQKAKHLAEVADGLPDEQKAKHLAEVADGLPDEHKAKAAGSLLAALPDEALKAYPPEVAAWIRAQRQPPAAPPS
ncbi:MAG TPA: hypothetical protein VGE74_08650, partial [Gemmata sp.]